MAGIVYKQIFLNLKTLISVIRNSVIYIMEKGKTDSHLLIYYQVVNLKKFYF